jgi:hypothetical protein
MDQTASAPDAASSVAALPGTILAHFVQNPMALFLLMIFMIICAILVYTQIKHDNFDLRYLISDDQRRPSLHKIGQLTALIVSTWAFVYLVLHDKLTETFYTVYMGIWASVTVLNKWADKHPGNYVTNVLPLAPTQTPSVQVNVGADNPQPPSS